MQNWKPWQKVTLGGVIFVALTLLIGFLWYASANDTEIALREHVKAKQLECESNRDKLHQTLFNIAQIPDQFMNKSKEAFKEIYPDLMEGRYGNERGGALMSWVTESNPQFDMASAAELYLDLQNAIKSNFKEFDKKQKELISAKEEHSKYIKKTMNNVFWNFRERGEVEIILLKSTRTMEDYSNNGQTEMLDLINNEEDSK
jgi:hypothetical protein